MDKKKAAYEPFGDEWKAEMKKWNKEMLIDFLRTKLIELQQIQRSQDGNYYTGEKSVKPTIEGCNKIFEMEKQILLEQKKLDKQPEIIKCYTCHTKEGVKGKDNYCTLCEHYF